MSSYSPMTVEEFLERDARGDFGDGVWELIDGFPELKMEGGTEEHGRLAARATAILDCRLTGPCVPGTTKGIRVPEQNKITKQRMYRPDFGVDCGNPEERRQSLQYIKPTMVGEILSRENAAYNENKTFVAYKPKFDMKLQSYRNIESIKYVLVVDQYKVRAILYGRTAEDWDISVFEDLTSAVEMPEVGVTIVLSELYKGIFDGCDLGM